jgi:hypothetical protein
LDPYPDLVAQLWIRIRLEVRDPTRSGSKQTAGLPHSEDDIRSPRTIHDYKFPYLHLVFFHSVFFIQGALSIFIEFVPFFFGGGGEETLQVQYMYFYRSGKHKSAAHIEAVHLTDTGRFVSS